jgi:hypothetical protein
MWRLRRQVPGEALLAREGDLVIDGRIQARLLRMRLLDLDAHVVVTPARPPLTARGVRPVPAREVVPRSAARDHGHAAPPRRRPSLGPGRATAPALGRAEQLIAEAGSIIDEASRLR